jgi:hypothetical protein
MPEANDPNANPQNNTGAGDADSDAQKIADQRLANVVNATVSSHLKRLKLDDIETRISGSLNKALEPFQQFFKSQTGAAGDAGTQDRQPSAGGGTNPGAPERQDPRLRLFEEKLAKQEAELAAERKARAETEERARVSKIHGDLRNALQGVVRPELLDAAHLMLRTNALKFDEDGRPLVTVKRARSKGQNPEALDFDDLALAVKDWALSDEAKPFLTPPDAGVARRGPGAVAMGNRRAMTPPKPAETEDEAARNLAADLQSRGVTSLHRAFR